MGEVKGRGKGVGSTGKAWKTGEGVCGGGWGGVESLGVGDERLPSGLEWK